MSTPCGFCRRRGSNELRAGSRGKGALSEEAQFRLTNSWMPRGSARRVLIKMNSKKTKSRIAQSPQGKGAVWV
ncbi:MAG: hypothetical protein ACREJN_11910 [Nitrospiraceae bacterium]